MKLENFFNKNKGMLSSAPYYNVQVMLLSNHDKYNNS
jgi:hypothetical protein